VLKHHFFAIFLFTQIIFFSQNLNAKIHPITPIPGSVPHDSAKAELGKAIFFDPILSVDNTISCAHCHNLDLGGTDGLPVSIGVKKQEGDINAPTVLNAVFNFRQFWNGRAKDLAEQAAGPIQNPAEMGEDFDTLIAKLNKSKYKAQFRSIYKQSLNKNQILEVLAEYQKLLITPNGDFDRYLQGEDDAISPQAKRGYELFKTKGCIVCHHGVNVGGNFYSKIGVVKPIHTTTLGRFEITLDEFDKHMVKVPTLRNIEKTAPYFHHGQTKTLKEAITTMAEFQLGINLANEQVDDIIAFLHTLGGDLPDAVLP
jgi:cytochrome c peroxidase